MLETELAQYGMIAMVFVASMSIILVVAWPFLSGERQQKKRIDSLAQVQAKRRGVNLDAQQQRRKQVQQTLEELDARKKEQKKITLRQRLTRAGLKWEPKTYYMFSFFAGLGTTLFVFLTTPSGFFSLLAGFAGGFGLPRWWVNRLAKRRQKKFLKEFANVIDVIVRGVRSGLPLNDCMEIISKEAPEPVRGEFARIVEQQKVGVQLPEVLARFYDRLPLQEVSFFNIVLVIQLQSGGNLAEALTNLSEVLRGRKRLQGKVQAFSAEAKTSAAIIGALPILVMLLVYVTTPDYISLLWTEQNGQIMLACSAIWMTLGVLVMRKMINFDY